MSEKNVQTEKAKKDLKNGAGLGQLTLTLCAICAACALLLGLTNMVTAPIIAANAEAKKTAAIAEKVLPGFTGTLTEMYYIGTDKTIKSVQQGSDGSFVVEVSPKSSYSGNLTLLIGINPDKTIAGISVSSSGETEGIGANALKDEYFAAQYVGKTGPVELTKNGGQVEGITGATFTSTGVKDAVNSAYAALENLSADASQVPDAPMISENIISMAQDGDGYVAVVDCGDDSFSKTLVIEVRIGADRAVTGVTILESEETPGLGAKASEPEFIDQFIGVDSEVTWTTEENPEGTIQSISGASRTSGAICMGVNAALAAIDYPDQWPTAPVGPAEPTAPAVEDSPVTVAEEGDGYVVTVDCGPDSFSKTLKIEVRLDADKTVTSVTVVESGETDGFGARASEPEFIDQFVGVNSAVSLIKNGGNIESISGASITSNAVCKGVNAALEALGVEMPKEPTEPVESAEPVETAGPVESQPASTSGEDGYTTVEVDCGPNSFSKTLKIAVRLDANKTVVGVTILESNETPGLGARASEPEFLNQFIGVKSAVSVITKENPDGNIDGISGATVTSAAVCNGVNAALGFTGVQPPTPTPTPVPTPTPEPTATPAPVETPAPAANSEPVVDGNVTLTKDGDGYVAVVNCGPDSFSKTLKIEVRISANKKVTGVTILESDETPGLGARASEPEFIDQFVGVNSEVTWTTEKNPEGDIQSIAGASVTSGAICKGVNEALRVAKAQG